ncbi:AI-2E family transporter [Psychroflexus halocasei]|uniref:Predicted PurR-regulated permease PerM n=1 Tax=Psychroflexus halocasei TaxID=908615 RepID=A0A1H4CGI2_9FLAO|nr:AI-2E family transporter [Psychroflexus halocasei]SEA59464.1 Predicted PurR-regulated permease PerM [Psychroflexus halocasei]
MSENNQAQKEKTFTQKVWIVGFIFALIATILLLIEATFNIFILVLAGALAASFFRGLSDIIQRKTKLKANLSLALSVIGTTLILAGLIFLIGAKVVSQTNKMQEKIPEVINMVKEELNETDVGQELIAQTKRMRSSDELMTFISKFFKTTFGGLGDIYIIFMVGAFFTVAPSLYTDGIKQLVPPKHREKTNDLLLRLGSGLKKWLAGKLIAMLAVFILTAIGLIILDIPLWLTLAIIAGLLNFIPNFGPLAAMIPAVLIALSESPTMALIVAGLYMVIQLFESSVITPKAQHRLIKIPPALIILAQIFIGALTGIWGVIFATPLVLIIIILVQELYVKPMNERAKLKSVK